MKQTVLVTVAVTMFLSTIMLWTYVIAIGKNNVVAPRPVAMTTWSV